MQESAAGRSEGPGLPQSRSARPPPPQAGSPGHPATPGDRRFQNIDELRSDERSSDQRMPTDDKTARANNRPENSTMTVCGRWGAIALAFCAWTVCAPGRAAADGYGAGAGRVVLDGPRP